MAFLECFVHPAAGFFLLALILPFFRGRIWRWLLFVPPLSAIFLAFRMKSGSYWALSYVGQNLAITILRKRGLDDSSLEAGQL